MNILKGAMHYSEYIYTLIEINVYNILGASWLHKLKNEILKEYDDFAYEDTSTTVKGDKIFVAYEAPMRVPNQNKNQNNYPPLIHVLFYSGTVLSWVPHRQQTYDHF